MSWTSFLHFDLPLVAQVARSGLSLRVLLLLSFFVFVVGTLITGMARSLRKAPWQAVYLPPLFMLVAVGVGLNYCLLEVRLPPPRLMRIDEVSIDLRLTEHRVRNLQLLADKNESFAPPFVIGALANASPAVQLNSGLVHAAALQLEGSQPDPLFSSEGAAPSVEAPTGEQPAPPAAAAEPDGQQTQPASPESADPATPTSDASVQTIPGIAEASEETPTEAVDVPPPLTALPQTTPPLATPPDGPSVPATDGAIELQDLGAAAKRPAWVTQSYEADGSSALNTAVVSVLGSRSEMAAREELAWKALEQLRQSAPNVASSLRGIRPEGDMLKENSISDEALAICRERFLPLLMPERNIYIEPQVTSVGSERVTVYNAWGKLEMDDLSMQGLRNFLRQDVHRRETEQRLKFLGMLSGATFFLLSIGFVYLKLDTATKGFYTWRLRLLAAVAAIGVSVLTLYIMRAR